MWEPLSTALITDALMCSCWNAGVLCTKYTLDYRSFLLHVLTAKQQEACHKIKYHKKTVKNLTCEAAFLTVYQQSVAVLTTVGNGNCCVGPWLWITDTEYMGSNLSYHNTKDFRHTKPKEVCPRKSATAVSWYILPEVSCPLEQVFTKSYCYTWS